MFSVPARSATHSPVAAKRKTTDSWKALTYSASAPKIVPKASNSPLTTHQAPTARATDGAATSAPARRCASPSVLGERARDGAWPADAGTSHVLDRRRHEQGEHEQRLDDVGHRRSTPVAARKLDPVRRAANTKAVGIAISTRLRATRATSRPSQP